MNYNMLVLASSLPQVLHRGILLANSELLPIGPVRNNYNKMMKCI